MNLLDQLDATPPWLCRLMCIEPKTGAGLPVRPIPLPVLVKRSRMPRRTFQQISWLSSYRGIPADRVSKFWTACGIDADPAKRQEQIYQFMRAHGAYVFKLAPRKMARAKLRRLDRQYQKWCEKGRFT